MAIHLNIRPAHRSSLDLTLEETSNCALGSEITGNTVAVPLDYIQRASNLEWAPQGISDDFYLFVHVVQHI